MPAAKKRPTAAETERVTREYFEAIERGEADAPLHHYAPDARGMLPGGRTATREEVAAWFAEIHAAFPDWKFEILHIFAKGDRATVRWRNTGTFAGPGTFDGFAPTGRRAVIDGVDSVRVADGQIAALEAFYDQMAVARQLGLMPPQGSAQDLRLQKLLNARTRLARRFAAGRLEQIAQDVWLLRGGFPQRTMNVYFVRDGDGVLVFDAGIHAMAPAITAAGAELGGITRVLLSHAHADHRGAAPELGAPVLCHPADRDDAQGDGGEHYFQLEQLDWHGRLALPRLLPLWDGGPVQIADTVEEGDVLAGFRVVHLPGHAPGMIGLFRESDRLALVSDCFYTLDPQSGIKGAPRVPHHAFNADTEQARASMLKLAAMEPAAAWPGHADPVTGDVRSQLERAAAA